HGRGCCPRSGPAAPPQRRIFRSRRSGCRGLIRRGGRFHRIVPQCSWSFFAPWELSISHPFVCWAGFAIIEMASECGRNAQQIVSYHDICFLTLSCKDFSPFLATLGAGLPPDVRVLVMATSARRRWSAALV